MSWQCDVNGISTASWAAKISLTAAAAAANVSISFLISFLAEARGASFGVHGCVVFVTPSTCHGSKEPEGNVTLTAARVLGMPYCVLLQLVRGGAPFIWNTTSQMSVNDFKSMYFDMVENASIEGSVPTT